MGIFRESSLETKKWVWSLIDKSRQNNQLNSILVPHIPGLRAKDVINFVKEKVDIQSYLPELKKDNKLPDRSWSWNFFWSHSIVNTFWPKNLKTSWWKLFNSKYKMLVMKMMDVEVLSEFYDLFWNSETLSRKIITSWLFIRGKREIGDLSEESQKTAFSNKGRKRQSANKLKKEIIKKKTNWIKNWN